MADELAPLKQSLADLLAAQRGEAGFTQRELAGKISYSREAVATAESGHRLPAEQFWSRCDDVLACGGRLLRAYQQVTDARRKSARRQDPAKPGRRLPAQRPPAAGNSGVDTLSPDAGLQGIGGYVSGHPAEPVAVTKGAAVAGEAATIRGVLDALTASDRQFGAGLASTFAAGYFGDVVWPRLGTAAGPGRAELFAVATEFALRVAGMHLDEADMTGCRRMLRLAAGTAEEAGDLSLSAWVLARRGELETHAGDLRSARAYSAAACGMATGAPGGARAFILAKFAHVQARSGDAAGTARTLADAHSALERAGSVVEPVWMGSYGWGHVRHEEALCYAALGLGTKTVTAATDALQVRNPERQPRPHAFTLGILAIGEAHHGDLDAATAHGRDLATLAAGMNSRRLRARLAALLHVLDQHAGHPAVRHLRDAAHPLLTLPPDR